MSKLKGIISTYASGVDAVFEWKIDNFFSLPETDGEVYWSPDFFFGGERWFLKISPNGYSLNYSSGHVSLELWKRCCDHSIRLSFSLSLKTAEGEKYNKQHFSKDFPKYYGAHVLKRFVPRSELSRRRSDLVPDGTLTVICKMKSSASAGRDIEKQQCSGVKNFFYKAENDPDHVAVEVSTQTVEASIQSVEASTQTVEEKCEACASGSSTNPQERKVLHDLKELFFNKEDCDVTIKVKGSEFPAHRAILKARSPVFASTFRHDMKENTTGVLEIQDCDSSIFSDFLCFLYCGDVGIISQENVFGLFTAADKYEVLDLRAKCLKFIKMNITVDTFCETITLALRHFETELIRLCTDYFKRNVPKIIVTVKWQTFLAENPTEGNELFVKSFVPNNN